MKIVCACGGSYKSFYLNYFINLKSCDLLIFNFGIIYDYNLENETRGDRIVNKELSMLSKKLNATIVAGVNIIDKEIYQGIIVCNRDKITLARADKGVKVFCKNRLFAIGNSNMKAQQTNKIILTNKRIYPNLKHCRRNKTFIFCDKFGVVVVQNQKLTRKFYKYSKIILK